MSLSLQQLIEHFAEALRDVDKQGVPYRTYAAGVGPYGEPDAVRAALRYLQNNYPSVYQNARATSSPDLIIPNEWIVEVKQLRPFGNNDEEAEHWSQKVLHPYPGNKSSLGDCLKLIGSSFTESKAIMVFGYEHIPAQIDLEPALKSFELIAEHVLGIDLSERHTAEIGKLIHSVHQYGRVYGWEVKGFL
jgi:hypothetical protein